MKIGDSYNLSYAKLFLVLLIPNRSLVPAIMVRFKCYNSIGPSSQIFTAG